MVSDCVGYFVVLILWQHLFRRYGIVLSNEKGSLTMLYLLVADGKVSRNIAVPI